MNTSAKLRLLSTLTTRDSAGRHFTERVNDAELAELETAGLIEISRPVHEATGIPYDRQHWAVQVTEYGVALLEANPEDWAAV